MNIDHWPAKQCNVEQLGKKISSAYQKPTYIAFNTQIIVSGQDPVLNKNLSTEFKSLRSFQSFKTLSKRNYISDLVYIAAYNGHASIIKKLARYNVNFDVTSHGTPPIHVAVQNRQVRCINELAKLGANLNTTNGGFPPIYIAAQRKMLAEIELLVKLGANINQKNYDGVTALIHAAEDGLLDVVNKLLSLGADVNLQTKTGATAFYCAAYCGHSGIIHELARHGANPRITKHNGWSPIHIVHLKDINPL